MSAPYHQSPYATGPARPRCAVCREPVYSRGDMHPQCAVRQSDLLEAAERKKAQAAPPASAD